jgi:hypothetical protein
MKQLFLFAFLLLSFSCKKESDSPGELADDYSNRSVGASAADLLRGTNATALQIEIQYMSGFAPDANAVEHLQSMVTTILNKPGGISIVQREIPAANKGVYSLDDIRSIEKQYRSAYTSGTTVAVNILIVDGSYTNASVLGIAYRNTSIVLFGKTIHENSGGIGQASRTKLEATVLEHEFAHLCGLVNVGTPIVVNHQDSSHGNHCNNTDCLMYYASETTDILGFLLTGAIPELDTNCRNDLRANGGN